MTQDPKDVVAARVKLLTQFRQDIRSWFDGNHEADSSALRTRISRAVRRVHDIVKDVGCLKLVTIAPPPIIGGLVQAGVDPFVSIFQNHYGLSLIPTVVDTIDETIGVLESPEYLEKLALEEATKDTKVADFARGLQRVIHICRRFPLVARQLQQRHDHRPSHSIDDEYDVQDLMHALLRIDFEDVRPEEYTPSYAGSASRMDFLLKRERIVLEIKKTRLTLRAKEVADQLLIDIARYKRHPDCSALVCFVYDSDFRIGNPAALEEDLSEVHDGRDVRVIVAPKS